MATTFKARKNENFYRDNVSNKDQGRYEVVQYDDGKYSAVVCYEPTLQEANANAKLRQSDEDAGVTIQGQIAADWHACENGMATELCAYYDNLPALSKKHGFEKAEAMHPWRLRQVAA